MTGVMYYGRQLTVPNQCLVLRKSLIIPIMMKWSWIQGKTKVAHTQSVHVLCVLFWSQNGILHKTVTFPIQILSSLLNVSFSPPSVGALFPLLAPQELSFCTQKLNFWGASMGKRAPWDVHRNRNDVLRSTPIMMKWLWICGRTCCIYTVSQSRTQM